MVVCRPDPSLGKMQGRGRSSMAERQLPKLHTRVRFPPPAPVVAHRRSRSDSHEKSAGITNICCYHRNNWLVRAGDQALCVFTVYDQPWQKLAGRVNHIYRLFHYSQPIYWWHWRFQPPLSYQRTKYGLFSPGLASTQQITASIIIVEMVYNVLLRQLWQPEGVNLILDIVLHDIMPVSFVLFWWFNVPKDNLRWTDVSTLWLCARSLECNGCSGSVRHIVIVADSAEPRSIKNTKKNLIFGLQGASLKFYHFKIFLARATFGASPVHWDIFPSGARSNAVFGAALGLVVNPSTNITNPGFH